MEITDLYGTFYQEMLNYCSTLTKNRASAEDLVQESYIRAITHWSDLQELDRGQRRAWLYKTARNLFIDQCRKQARETPAEDEQFAIVPFEDDLSQVAAAQLIGRLPENERALFSLRYLEGYNSSELGRMFNLPAATVRARLASAKKRLRKWLGDTYQ